MAFPTGYSMIELCRTNLRRHRDTSAVALPAKQIGFSISCGRFDPEPIPRGTTAPS